MAGDGIPSSTLYPIIFALISFVVIVLFIGLSMAVRQQNRRNERYINWLQAQVEQADRLHEVSQPRPVLWQVVGEEEKSEVLGLEKQSTWQGGMSPASILPLPHPPHKRVLPSTCPPLLLSAIILQPQPPRNPSDPLFGDDDDDDGYGEDLSPLGNAAAGVEVDLGMEQVEVIGDWRKIVGKTDFGFEF